MNGLKDRDEAIDLMFTVKAIDLKYPSLSESGKYFNGRLPYPCQYQGYFYPEFEDEEF